MRLDGEYQLIPARLHSPGQGWTGKAMAHRFTLYQKPYQGTAIAFAEIAKLFEARFAVPQTSFLVQARAFSR